MGYDEMRSIGGAIGLVGLFVGFVGVIVYAMWPANKKRFDHAATMPLDDDTPADTLHRTTRYTDELGGRSK